MHLEAGWAAIQSSENSYHLPGIIFPWVHHFTWWRKGVNVANWFQSIAWPHWSQGKCIDLHELRHFFIQIIMSNYLNNQTVVSTTSSFIIILISCASERHECHTQPIARKWLRRMRWDGREKKSHHNSWKVFFTLLLVLFSVHLKLVDTSVSTVDHSTSLLLQRHNPLTVSPAVFQLNELHELPEQLRKKVRHTKLKGSMSNSLLSLSLPPVSCFFAASTTVTQLCSFYIQSEHRSLAVSMQHDNHSGSPCKGASPFISHLCTLRLSCDKCDSLCCCSYSHSEYSSQLWFTANLDETSSDLDEPTKTIGKKGSTSWFQVESNHQPAGGTAAADHYTRRQRASCILGAVVSAGGLHDKSLVRIRSWTSLFSFFSKKSSSSEASWWSGCAFFNGCEGSFAMN